MAFILTERKPMWDTIIVGSAGLVANYIPSILFPLWKKDQRLYFQNKVHTSFLRTGFKNPVTNPLKDPFDDDRPQVRKHPWDN